MKMVETVGTVRTSGDITPTSFRIKASRKAFEILSAGLYSDKVRAIIRELSTNAFDAHVAAGKSDVPFTVHLPNHMEPWFAVTDYGVGLSDDAVLNVYTTYFESDKCGSNDFTGCLGLGSKSPFSYTDSFTVESRFNGVKRVYSAYLGEDGMPSITKMTENPTDEPNGLTVKFPVKHGDFDAFQTKAEQTLQWFRVRPTVTGWSGFEYPQRTFLRQTDKYGVYKTREYGRHSQVVMGNVAYPIQSGEFLTGYDNETSRLRNLVDWGVELYVNVGDCDISASREKLGYDKRTVRHLKERLRATLDDLEKEVTKEIANKPTLWEARKALHEVRTSFQGFDFKAEWGGQSILDYVKVKAKEVEVPDEIKGGTKKVERPVAVVESIKLKSRRDSGVVVKKDRADTIYADGTVIFLNDERGAYANIRRYLDEKGDYSTRVYLISDYDHEWLKETGISDVAIKASTLPKPIRTATGPRGGCQKAKLYEFVPAGGSNNGSSTAAGYWTPAEVDVDEGGVYVEILYFNYRMKEGEATNHPADLNRPLKLLTALGKGVTVYGIRPSDKPLLDKSEGEWRTLKEYALDVAKEAEATYHADLFKAREIRCIMASGYPYRKKVPFEDFSTLKFDSESPFGQFIRRCMDAKKALDDDKVEAYGNLRQWTGLPTYTEEEVQGLDEAQTALFKTYPLLQYINAYHMEGEGAKHVAEYVNMIDNREDGKAQEAA